MKRKNLKSLIAMALVVSSTTTLALPTIVQAEELLKNKDEIIEIQDEQSEEVQEDVVEEVQEEVQEEIIEEVVKEETEDIIDEIEEEVSNEAINETTEIKNETVKDEYEEIFKQDERTIAQYEQLRAKWAELLTGNSLAGLNDVDAIKNIADMDLKVEASLNNADISEGTPYIWTELVDNASKSATITAQFKRLKEISVAYKTKDSRYYNNTELLELILKGTGKMYTKHYNEEIKSMPNNWWDWQIGAPREVVDIMVLMDAELGELKASLIKTIDRFIPDPTKRVGQSDSFRETGANLIDKSQIVAVRAISEGNSDKVKQAADAIKGVFPYVTKGDGFYRDGSFLQHGDIAYTGSYGAVLLNGLSNCLYIIQDTENKIDTADYYNLFRWMKDSYEPVMAIGGNIMDNVRGRAISRIAQQGDARGKFIISAMLRVANIAPNKEAEDYIKGITKGWLIEGSQASSNYFGGLSTGDIANMKNVLNDNSLQQAAERNYYKQFYYMDRAVSNRPDYNFTVSMSSTRIANHEDINGESTKAWYIGQGMTQLYTNDLQQYNEDFWPTVDAMRLPGVTTDGQTRRFTDKGNSSDWAGGTTVDNINGVSGMEILPQYRTTSGSASGMSAIKSWFMFENEIVAVGSNISSTSQNVETIVDNRKIKDNATNTLLVNGKEVNGSLGENTVKANWAHLEGNVANSDIGYVFPKETEIKTIRETRTNKWSEINTKAEFTDTLEKTRSYVSLAVDHGNAPTGETYEYIMLPNATAKQTEEYNENQPVQILANTDKVHAVYHKEQKIYAINVFEAGKISDNIEVDAPISMMIKEEDGKYIVAVSNPTKKASSVKITFTENILEKYDILGDVVVENNLVTVDTSNKSGETYKFEIVNKHVSVDSVTLDKTELELKEWEKMQLTATINPENSTVREVTWTSSNEEIAVVNSEGEIQAIGVGEAVITAEVEGKVATCKITVSKNHIVVESIKLDKTEITLKKGEKAQLNATINPTDATNKNVTWVTSNEEIATVNSNGEIEALSVGEVIITAKAGDKEVTCIVKVTTDKEDQKPGTGEDQKPGDEENQKPGTGGDEKPGAGENQKPGDIVIDDNKDNNSNGNNSINKPQTGDSNSLATLGLTLMASVSGLVILKKKNKK